MASHLSGMQEGFCGYRGVVGFAGYGQAVLATFSLSFGRTSCYLPFLILWSSTRAVLRSLIRPSIASDMGWEAVKVSRRGSCLQFSKLLLWSPPIPLVSLVAPSMRVLVMLDHELVRSGRIMEMQQSIYVVFVVSRCHTISYVSKHSSNSPGDSLEPQSLPDDKRYVPFWKGHSHTGAPSLAAATL